MRFWLILYSALVCSACSQSTINTPAQGKIAGLSIVAGRLEVSDSAWLKVEQTHANWLSLMPYAFGKLHDTLLLYNTERQWQGERLTGIAQAITQAHNRGFKVMLKPHLWLHGGYTGLHDVGSGQQWEIWEKHYTNYVLDYAQLADSLNVELFCIGTELTLSATKRPHYWRYLIDTVQSIYAGKLTYAANWDAYQEITFWNKLDYIGVDGYFPLVTAGKPSADKLKLAWQVHLAELEDFYLRHYKSILFTEWGYRSAKGATTKPWEHSERGLIDYEIQAMAYEAFFATVYPKPFIAGGFVWKWYSDPLRPGYSETDYTPQNKAAFNTLQRVYSNLKE